MKKYTCKTLEDCLNEASKELNTPVEELMYVIDEEKHGLFTKKVVISVSEITDVVEYAENYIVDACHALGFDVSVKSFIKNEFIKILIETNHNAVLIGKNGSNLQSLNDLVKLATNAKFKKRFRILLDIGDYKDKKYNRVIFVAKKSAKEVLKTHVDVKLEPMTPDERKKVHNTLSTWKNIKTESVGDGSNRSVVIKYVPGNEGTSTTSSKSSAIDFANDEEKTEE